MTKREFDMTFKTADLSDENEGRIQIVLPGLRNFGGNTRFYGEMVTIKSLGDFSLVREQVKSPGDGKVLVVDNEALMDCAMLGDLLAAEALDNAWQGVVINGCIRDSVDIAAMGIGVKALATIPMRGSGEGGGELNVVVEFLGAVFRPGEYLYSDEDGILLCADALI
jgi:regulator of ribonuclease activity A